MILNPADEFMLPSFSSSGEQRREEHMPTRAQMEVQSYQHACTRGHLAPKLVNTRSHTGSHDRYARCNSYTPCHHELLNQNIMLLYSHCKTAEGFCIVITQVYHSLLLLLPSCIFFSLLVYMYIYLFCSLLLHLMLLSCLYLCLLWHTLSQQCWRCRKWKIDWHYHLINRRTWKCDAAFPGALLMERS